jgi:hypothetical protein
VLAVAAQQLRGRRSDGVADLALVRDESEALVDALAGRLHAALARGERGGVEEALALRLADYGDLLRAVLLSACTPRSRLAGRPHAHIVRTLGFAAIHAAPMFHVRCCGGAAGPPSPMEANAGDAGGAGPAAHEWAAGKAWGNTRRELWASKTAAKLLPRAAFAGQVGLTGR